MHRETASVGYIALLRNNTLFRRLWYGQIVSQLGDWLDDIALFTLLLNLTGSGEAVGLLLVAQFLPGAFVSPFAGVIIDRLPRKLVLVASDLCRAAVVLVYLFVDQPSQVWIIYLAVALKMSFSAFFEPARSAIIPSLVSREELIAANAISGATWSAMLAIGAAIGGLVAGTLGIRAAFVLDAGTFLLSAALIGSIPLREVRRPGTQRVSLGRTFGEIGEGLRYVLQHHDVFWYTFTKMLWHLSGGVLLLLTLFGRDLFPLGRDGAISIGLLYASRGLGTGIGPILAQRIGGSGVPFLRRSIGVAFFISALGYLAFSGSPSFVLACLAVMFAHIGGSINWVFSTALLQTVVPDSLRGRIFAIEYAGLMLTLALSNYLTGVAHDAGWSPRILAVVLACLFIVPGTVLLLVLWNGQAQQALRTES